MGAHASHRRLVPASAVVGVLATLTMDAAFLAGARLGGEAYQSEKVGFEPIGRWALGLARGRLVNLDIAAGDTGASDISAGDAGAADNGQGEFLAGLAVHYATGISLTWAYFKMLRLARRESGIPVATLYGAATVLLPLLVMYPSWGLGAFGLRSGEAGRLARIMLLGHSTFGAGIGLWTALLRVRITPS